MKFIVVKFGPARCDEPWTLAGRVHATERGYPGMVHGSSHRASHSYHVASFLGAFNVRHYGPLLLPRSAGAAGAHQERSESPCGVQFIFSGSFLVTPAGPVWHVLKNCFPLVRNTGRRSAASTRGLGWVWRCLFASVLVA